MVVIQGKVCRSVKLVKLMMLVVLNANNDEVLTFVFIIIRYSI